jgi:hypothetical protein
LLKRVLQSFVTLFSVKGCVARLICCKKDLTEDGLLQQMTCENVVDLFQSKHPLQTDG